MEDDKILYKHCPSNCFMLPCCRVPVTQQSAVLPAVCRPTQLFDVTVVASLLLNSLLSYLLSADQHNCFMLPCCSVPVTQQSAVLPAVCRPTQLQGHLPARADDKRERNPLLRAPELQTT